MDNFLLFHESPKTLIIWRDEISSFLDELLKLILHTGQCSVQAATRLDFLGYVLFPQKILLRKKTVSRFGRRLRVQGISDKALSAWFGYASFADSYRLMEKLGLNSTKLTFVS